MNASICWQHLLASALGLVIVACASEQAGGLNPDAGTNPDAASQGGAGPGSGGAGPSGGTSGRGSGGTSAAGSGGSSGGSGGSSGGGGTSGSGGTSPGGGGTGAVSAACIYNDGFDGAAGAAGAPGEPTITLEQSPFIGSYLANADGITLYTYGGDIPGDCNHPPVSNCTTSCPASWPPYDAGALLVDAALDAALFGSFERDDGTRQTTYLGWPLYGYKSDTMPGTQAGQGKASLWHAAKLAQPEIVIMRAGDVKYLSDGRGFTLYSHVGDDLGTDDADPEVHCDAACRDLVTPYRGKHMSVVTSLDPNDFVVFTSPMLGRQVAYKGAPLYYAKSDTEPGDITGITNSDFALVEP